MTNSRAKELIRNNLSIPTLPVMVQRITALIDDPESSASEIGSALAQDAPLSAKILRIANSSYYGLRKRCLSTDQASSVLGLRVLKNVVTQAAVIQQFEHLRNAPGFDLDELWQHSVLTATTCAEMARLGRSRTGLAPEEFYVCGLLHDLGRIVMLDSMGEEYLEVHRAAGLCGEPLHHLERQRFGFDHTVVGGIVAERWALPPAAAAAIQFHHGPRERIADDPVVALVANANLVAQRVAANRIEEAERTLDEETADFLNLERAAVPALIQRVRESVSEIVV